jgi:L-threonylcarbamoyladenylate synthase
MPAMIITVDPHAPDSAALARLGAILRAGAVVAFPTETVYGLGADATNPEAVARIFAAKGRPSSDPLIAHIATLEMLPLVTDCALDQLPLAAQTLSAKFWPGPLTLILPRGNAMPLAVTAGRETVGVRFPNHPVARGLITAAGVPLAAPSANRFGHTSPTTAAHVAADLGERIGFILDAGPTQVGVESTILDVTRYPPVLLRPGGVPREAIEVALGSPVSYSGRIAASEDSAAVAPGMLLTHYAPNAPLTVYEGEDGKQVWARILAEVTRLTGQGQRVGVLAPEDYATPARQAGAREVFPLGRSQDDVAAAQRLFAGLRALDAAGVNIILTGSYGQAGLGLALRDRLWRAAGGKIITVDAPGD